MISDRSALKILYKIADPFMKTLNRRNSNENSAKAIFTNFYLGSLLLRNSQHADEFVQCATVIAKDFMFETKDYQIASGYSLLSYYFHLQMEKDKAVVLNGLSYNICKNLRALVSPLKKNSIFLRISSFSALGYVSRRSILFAC